MFTDPTAGYPPASLSPTTRAAVRVLLAHRLGDGQPVTRAQVLAELVAGYPPATGGGIRPTGVIVELLHPARPDVPAAAPAPVATPDPTPDVAVTFAEAAERLKLSVATVRRYSAPSSGKLVRLGTGVSLASLVALEAGR
ncbi:hypothetical protein [Frankia gtarii]|uniref:hypothetical protein n=1 Tax=Frankia gtarii TaxID=2950102 RepID=UPI0021C0628F|nr:hypothetical protein [Frankia gtarii]